MNIHIQTCMLAGTEKKVKTIYMTINSNIHTMKFLNSIYFHMYLFYNKHILLHKLTNVKLSYIKLTL